MSGVGVLANLQYTATDARVYKNIAAGVVYCVVAKEPPRLSAEKYNKTN